MRNYPNIKERGITLLLNAIFAYGIFTYVSGKLVPTGGLESVWLFSGLSFWFLSLLSAPWFTPPRDAVIAGVGALLILTTMEIDESVQFKADLELIRSASIVFSSAIIGFAVTALFLHDKDVRSPLGHFAFRVTGIFGRGEILFSMPAVISIIATYQFSFAVMNWLILYWILVTIGQPFERLAAAIKQFKEEKQLVIVQPTVGTISRIDHPNIIRVKLSSANSWQANRLFTASMSNGNQEYVVSLFTQIQGSEVVGTGLCVTTASEEIALPTGTVCASHDKKKTEEFLEKLSGASGAKLVGFVVEKSNIGVIRFEVSTNSELKEGDVVFVHLSKADVFYQIIGAETVEESFDQNPRGTHVVNATQLGVYSTTKGFTKFPWLPAMNAPLFSAGSRQFNAPVVGEREFSIGMVPSTNVDAIANIDDLVEHHTAVLGVTGTGKTELSLDIVRAAVARGIKVFCVDFTGEYRWRLKDLNPSFPSPTTQEASNLENKIFAVETGEYRAGKEKKELKDGINALRGSTGVQIKEFLESEDEKLAIFELAEIANTKASLRLTELYLSEIMEWARRHRKAKQVLLVLEEAHTIVPEVFGSGLDFDAQFVVSRIGQIALQGRKYGVGLLVISQRTALVSKTILSQCNTFLTHSLIDQTSLTFLQSVYSTQHTRLIPNLGRFEFLAYGKAIKAERPIVLRREFDQAKLDASLALRHQLPEKRANKEDARTEAEPLGPRIRKL